MYEIGIGNNSLIEIIFYAMAKIPQERKKELDALATQTEEKLATLKDKEAIYILASLLSKAVVRDQEAAVL